MSNVRAPRGKVVIVDDEPDVLESTSMMVQALGYIPVPVDDPSLVVDTVARERPGVILQDLRMPGLNLAGLVAALRLDPVAGEVPLVFFSAHTDVAQTASRHDAWGYLSKPFSPEELSRLLERAFAERTVRPEPALPKDVARDVRAMFHEQWNLIQALNNYTAVMRSAKGDSVLRALHGLEEVLLKLESRTDRLQSYMLGIANAMEAVPEAQVPTPRTQVSRSS